MYRRIQRKEDELLLLVVYEYLIQTVNIWCARTVNPKSPISNVAYNCTWISKNFFLFPLSFIIICEINTDPGKNETTYTSGWPKNQNERWYKIHIKSPLQKNDVLKFRSNSNIVIAPAIKLVKMKLMKLHVTRSLVVVRKSVSQRKRFKQQERRSRQKEIYTYIFFFILYIILA